MKRAQNSDSKTHVKKQNLNSRTEIRQKSLKYLFLETPCSFDRIVHNDKKGVENEQYIYISQVIF